MVSGMEMELLKAPRKRVLPREGHTARRKLNFVPISLYRFRRILVLVADLFVSCPCWLLCYLIGQTQDISLVLGRCGTKATSIVP